MVLELVLFVCVICGPAAHQQPTPSPSPQVTDADEFSSMDRASLEASARRLKETTQKLEKDLAKVTKEQAELNRKAEALQKENDALRKQIADAKARTSNNQLRPPEEAVRVVKRNRIAADIEQDKDWLHRSTGTSESVKAERELRATRVKENTQQLKELDAGKQPKEIPPLELRAGSWGMLEVVEVFQIVDKNSALCKPLPRSKRDETIFLVRGLDFSKSTDSDQVRVHLLAWVVETTTYSTLVGSKTVFVIEPVEE